MNGTWNMERALDESGLTLTEIADRAGFDPADVERLGYDRLPSSVLARLADILGLSTLQLLDFRAEQTPESPGDPSFLGAYMGEFPEGLTRDALAEALGWTLDRIERALAALDRDLHPCGLRLRIRDGGRVALAGRLDLTEGRARMSIERARASATLEVPIAVLVLRAVSGVARVRDNEQQHADIARRRGLVEHRQGCLRTTAPVDYSLLVNDRRLHPSEPWDEDQHLVRPC
ncbi:MAG: hypothetical protein ACRD2W_19560 [Acidimicrobiales bacterium]